MLIENKRHCHTYIRDKSQPMCLRKWLLYNRVPAIWKMRRWRKQWGIPTLFATYKGEQYRVVMASRLGDVGITKNLNALFGYELRVYIEDLSDFKEKV